MVEELHLFSFSLNLKDLHYICSFLKMESIKDEIYTTQQNKIMIPVISEDDFHPISAFFFSDTHKS